MTLVMAWCHQMKKGHHLMAPSHYLNQCLLILNGFCNIHMEETAQKILILSICEMLKSEFLKIMHFKKLSAKCMAFCSCLYLSRVLINHFKKWHLIDDDDCLTHCLKSWKLWIKHLSLGLSTVQCLLRVWYSARASAVTSMAKIRSCRHLWLVLEWITISLGSESWQAEQTTQLN